MSSSAAITISRVLGEQLEQLAEAVDRQQLGDVRPASSSSSAAISASSRCSGASSAAGAISTRVGLAERALGERREPAQRLDLDVEQVDADRALLGRRVDVEQPAADRELAAVLDLVDALVAGGDELGGGLVEVEQVADLRSVKPCGRSSGSGTFSESATAETTTTGCLGARAACPVSASSAATRRPTRCGGGVRCDS